MSELKFACKQLKLSSDGTPAGTSLVLDGKLVGRVVRLFFESDAKEPQVVATVEVVDEKENVCPPQVITFNQGE